MEKFSINNFVFEATRRCQLECEHCLRGDSENKDIKWTYLNELLQHVDYIDHITVTGGEPFLYPQAIIDFVNLCNLYKIEINSFFIATNGIIHETKSKLADHGLMAIIKLYSICKDNEYSSIRISNTKYHGINTSDANLLHIFADTHYEGADWIPQSYIAEGRGAGLWGTSKTEHNEIDWDDLSNVVVYLNCNGKILWNCNLSYETQKIEGISIEEALPILHSIRQKEFELENH